MAIKLLYFARIREAIGTSGESLTPPAEIVRLSDLIDWLSARSPAHAEAFADRTRLRAAIDQRFAPLDATIGAPREIALFPPVTGG